MSSQKELIPMRPGEILRHERRHRGLTLEQASGQSRIKLSVLSAIELNETEDIPSVYLKGYIRNYARFLGLSESDFEDSLQHVKGSEPEVRTVFTVNTNRGNAEKWLKTSSYLAASLLIAALAWQFTHQAVRFSQGNPSLASDETVVSDSTDKHLSASIAPVEVLKQSAKPAAGDSPAEQAWAAIGEQAERSVDLPDGQHRLEVTTSADTWVEIIAADGSHLEMDLIRAGSIRDYVAAGPLTVMIGRASAVVLKMDGESIDMGPHTRGNVARLTLGEVLQAENTAASEAEIR